MGRTSRALQASWTLWKMAVPLWAKATLSKLGSIGRTSFVPPSRSIRRAGASGRASDEESVSSPPAPPPAKVVAGPCGCVRRSFHARDREQDKGHDVGEAHPGSRSAEHQPAQESADQEAAHGPPTSPRAGAVSRVARGATACPVAGGAVEGRRRRRIAPGASTSTGTAPAGARRRFLRPEQ